MTVENSLELLIFMRIAERALIVMIVLVATIYLMIALSRKIQKIKLDFDTSAGAAKASITVAMPVFLLLVLIIFSYVAFSTPVSFTEKTTVPQDSAASNLQTLQREVQVVGYQGLDRDILLDIRAINSVLNEINDLGGIIRLEEEDREWAIVDTSVRSALQASIKVAELRLDLIELVFGDDVLQRCGREWTSKLADNNYSVNADCSEFVDLIMDEL